MAAEPQPGRAGVRRAEPSGYRAFYPTDLPVEPPIDLNKLQPQLGDANVALGRIDSLSEFIPNPDLFVFMYVRKEAVLSSQIEGTQASLNDLLEYEAGLFEDAGGTSDVDEIANYVAAMNHGLQRLDTLPLCARLLCEIHAKLLDGTRGQDRTPGEFRRSQNWIGKGGGTLADAVFVPPPHHELGRLMSNLERYLQSQDSTPVLVRAGVAHAQFETIHPFLDGNGRLGRLLVTLMLCERRVLSRPLLYLSYYFKKNQGEYYDWLMRVRSDGDWEGWLSFFLQGVVEVSEQARETARRVLQLQKDDRDKVRSELPRRAQAPHLLDLLYTRPIVSVQHVQKELSCTFGTANTLIAEFERLGILKEITGRQRDRVFKHTTYLSALSPQD